jgi:hypothetical protein
MNTVQSRQLNARLVAMWHNAINNRAKAFGFMIVGALLAFEVFNYSTTEFALNDVLGNLTFASIKWSTILAIAFCGIDFAGIARIFTPETGADEPAEVWYLFGAWLLAAAMNAMLTWWGVSVAIVNHNSMGTAMLGSATIRNVVPVFVAIMVWVIRVLIIGTFSLAGERLLNPGAEVRRPNYRRTEPAQPVRAASINNNYSRPVLTTAANLRPAPKPLSQQSSNYAHQEPTYTNLSMGAKPAQNTVEYERHLD